MKKYLFSALLCYALLKAVAVCSCPKIQLFFSLQQLILLRMRRAIVDVKVLFVDVLSPVQTYNQGKLALRSR